MSEGKIKFSCDCGKAYKVPEEYAGKKIRCKECNESILIPSKSESITSARAEAVSQRSVVTSKRLSKAGGDDEKPRATATKPAAPARRPGGDTQVIEIPDIAQERKKYERKRDEEIKKGEGKLVQFAEGKPVKSYRLDKETRTLGRGSKCEIQVDDKTVSKEHVRFEYKMGMFIATDLSSANGLVVNGKKLRRASLKDCDVIQLGGVVFRLDCGK